ncbi:conserved repeat domain protein [Coraliomargarita akajimensis DSM 45221]|uniref:Conserved repeat domain protein n=1 Tax=Coraliomargarita akajimensis (strain DSM 45221 / IAM 15411 / JCM 23193 / KCTC 12865 / 04OKA010-24) TaxID=583355 RepID=D5EJC2_CORAD|nr:conserved repeat domain protein [Coraliomargarita akajimensis DSM 45221]
MNSRSSLTACILLQAPRKVRLLAACAVAISFLSGLYAQQDPSAAKKPKKNWIASVSAMDEFGESAQGVAPGFVYADDRYENLDYSRSTAASADIKVLRAGLDRDFLYVSFEFVEGWSASRSQSNSIAIEVDFDHPVEFNRGDRVFAFNMRSEFNRNENWQDAKDNGGFFPFDDKNDDVGGADPLASDFPDDNLDGYDDGLNEEEGELFGRVMADGRFEIAVARNLSGSGNTDIVRVKVWTLQNREFDSSFANEFNFHDTNSSGNIPLLDSYPGADMDDWIQVPELSPNDIDLELTQTADVSDPKIGELVTFTVDLAHILGNAEAQAVVVESLLAEGLAFVSANPEQGVYDPATNRWTLPSVASGQTRRLEIVAMVDAALPCVPVEHTVKLLQLDNAEDVIDANNESILAVEIAAHDGSIRFVGDLSGAPIGTVNPGEDLFVQVDDLDLDMDPLVAETVDVKVQVVDFDEVEFTLTETGPNTAQFTGSVATEVNDSANRFDDVLQLRIGDTAVAEYVDALADDCSTNVLRQDELTFDGPAIVLTKAVDKSEAGPGELLTYKVVYRNIGLSAAKDLLVQERIPLFTVYEPQSMRVGFSEDEYASALQLTDEDDGVEGSINGADVGAVLDGDFVRIAISDVAADDGASGSGPDSGSVFFQVKVAE